MTDNLQAELLFSYAACWTLQWLKGQAWFPWVTGEEKNFNKAAAGFLAFIGSAGIVLSAQHAGVGHWVIDVSGLTWANVAHVAGHAVRLYGEQKLWFKTVVSTPNTAMAQFGIQGGPVKP
jgi:hypothetical protein